MCGIAGIKLFNSRPAISQESNLRAAIALQSHRGPDATHIHSFGDVILGHNRLAIIDTESRSDQPFVSEDGKYAIVFNGEIYNYLEIKSVLLKKGVSFSTESDTEVLLKLLIQEGKNALRKLRGCFAFCFVEIATGKLLLARDTMGIKPLLYRLDAKGFSFASELSVLLDRQTTPDVDLKALSAFFQYSYFPDATTAVKGVKRLLPGHYMEVDTEIRINEYRQLIGKSSTDLSFEAAVERTKQLVEESVVSQLVADVPLGTFLSGGIDSSIVSLVAAKNVSGLNTFSISFAENDLLDEGKQAESTAKFLGSNHHSIVLDRNAVVDDLDCFLDSLDEPFADSSAVAMYFLSRETRKFVTAALSGDGADELFGGYAKYGAFLKANSLGKTTRLAISIASKLGKGNREGKAANFLRKINKMDDFLRLPAPENLNLLASMIDYNFPAKILKRFSRYSLYEASDAIDLNSYLLADQRVVLPGDMLRKTDAMSMRHSLEVRTPFLDEKLIAFVNSLPSKWKHDGSKGKILLREAFGNELPGEIFQRPKRGFEVPLAAWLTDFDPLKRYPDLFSREFLVMQDIFSADGVLVMIQQFNKGDKSHAQSLWAFLTFQKWYKRNFVQ